MDANVTKVFTKPFSNLVNISIINTFQNLFNHVDVNILKGFYKINLYPLCKSIYIIFFQTIDFKQDIE